MVISVAILMIPGKYLSRLNFGLILVTMFVSMWTSNSVAMSTMIPIVKAVLEGLEHVGFSFA